MKKIGMIGFGNMGEAIAAGLIRQKAPYLIQISELKEDRIQTAKSAYNISNIENKNSLVAGSDIILIAVKPQELKQLFSEIKGGAKNKQIISICAGSPISFFQENLDTRIVSRFMPNLAALEGAAATGVSFSSGADESFKTDCLSIAGAIGTVYEINENLMAAITGLSGSGIAFVFAFIHAMALGGTASGIPYNKSLDISLQTIEGALAVLKKNKVNPVEMLSRVISPAGTTIKGIQALEKGCFTSSVIDAVESAAKRAREMEG